MKRQFEELKQAIASKAQSFIQAREKFYEERKDNLARKAKAEKAHLKKRLRESVSGPDSPEATRLWMEVFGRRPDDDISEVYALRAKDWSTVNHISFVFASDNALANALRDTHWSGAIRGLRDGAEGVVRQRGIPKWESYWPCRPSTGSAKGGRERTMPFVSDYYYYYLDKSKNRFFLTTGMTNQEFAEYNHGKIERSRNQPS